MSQQSVDPFMDAIDLDAERKQRAAAREGKQQNLPIRFGGEVIATLPVELPIDVAEPLRNLDADLTLILREVMGAMRGKDGVSATETTELVVDVLAMNPALPVTVLDTLTQVAKNLLTEEGFALLMRQRPAGQDFAALAKGVFRFYGVSLGESSALSDLSAGSGTTSTPTSPTTTPASISETSTPTPGPSMPTVADGSSESVAS